MKYNEQDMAQLISEVETEFKEYLTKAEQLVKSDKEIEKVSLEKSEEEFDYDEDDIKEMNDMYASMTKSEKEAHYAAIKSVIFSESEEKDLKKSEQSVKSDEEAKMLKSELESSKKETEELKKSIETLTSIVSKIVKKVPSRKAVTQIGNIQVMKKSEESVVEDSKNVDYSTMKKAEINKILTGKIRNGEIKKAEDKEKINQFCYGQIKIDEIKHLL